MVIDCIETSVPGRFFLKSGIVFLRASLATSHEATVMPPPPDEDPPHPASVPPPSRAAPASPAPPRLQHRPPTPARAPPHRGAAPASPRPPSLKNCRRFMPPPLTHLTLLPVDKPSPFRSTAQDAASARGFAHNYAGREKIMC